MGNSLTIIRDPIHNYIALSEIESALIGDPLFQRLRHVSQNALAHLVYPSNRTSRFIHSLGTMHLSGQFLLRGVANANTDDLKYFWAGVSGVLKQAEDALSAYPDRMKKYLKDTNDPFYRQSGLDPSDPEDFDKITLLQSIRLASVMHDLGHPPFSHTVEQVLFDCFLTGDNKPQSASLKEFMEILRSLFKTQEGAPRPGDLHEAIGRALMGFVFKRFSEEQREFATYCFLIVKEIANKRFVSEDPHGIVECLHGIVSGELDADRCDYVKRDGYASGFEFGDYDIERILCTVRFRRNPKRGEKFDLVPSTVAVSALESFFLERYRIYKWLVFHPMVVRVNVALARAVVILLEIYFEEETEGEAEGILNILQEMDFDRLWKCFKDEETYDQYAYCEENWLLTLLRRVHLLLCKASGPLPLRQVALRVYLDVVCDRRKEYVHPFWKRQEGYQDFAEKVAEKLSEEAKLPNELMRADGMRENEVTWCNRVMVAILGDNIEEKGRIATMREFEREIQGSLKSYGWHGGIVADLLRFSPYEGLSLVDARDENNMVSLEDLSTIVKGLKNMWDNEIRFRPFWFARDEFDGGYMLAKPGRGDPPPLRSFCKAVVETLLRWERSEGSG